MNVNKINYIAKKLSGLHICYGNNVIPTLVTHHCPEGPQRSDGLLSSCPTNLSNAPLSQRSDGLLSSCPTNLSNAPLPWGATVIRRTPVIMFSVVYCVSQRRLADVFTRVWPCNWVQSYHHRGVRYRNNVNSVCVGTGIKTLGSCQM